MARRGGSQNPGPQALPQWIWWRPHTQKSNKQEKENINRTVTKNVLRFGAGPRPPWLRPCFFVCWFVCKIATPRTHPRTWVAREKTHQWCAGIRSVLAYHVQTHKQINKQFSFSFFFLQWCRIFVLFSTVFAMIRTAPQRFPKPLRTHTNGA